MVILAVDKSFLLSLWAIYVPMGGAPSWTFQTWQVLMVMVTTLMMSMSICWKKHLTSPQTSIRCQKWSYSLFRSVVWRNFHQALQLASMVPSVTTGTTCECYNATTCTILIPAIPNGWGYLCWKIMSMTEWLRLSKETQHIPPGYEATCAWSTWRVVRKVPQLKGFAMQKPWGLRTSHRWCVGLSSSVHHWS